MAHFTALVLLSPSTSNIQAQVRELLNPYYSGLAVEPYRQYLSQAAVEQELKNLEALPEETIKALTAAAEISHDDLEGLAKRMLGWYDDEVDGVDEKGSYRVTTINPQAKWDWYRLIEAQPSESVTSLSYPCRVAELPAVVPYALVEPNGRWHDIGFRAGVEALVRKLRQEATPSHKETEWQLKVREMLARYPDELAVALNCHH